MKRIVLSLILSIMIITSNLQAIDSGKYFCHGNYTAAVKLATAFYGTTYFDGEERSLIVNLKKSGNYKLTSIDGEVGQRGKWEDDEDEAILNYTGSETVGANMFGFGGVKHQTKETIIFIEKGKNNFTFDGLKCKKHTDSLVAKFIFQQSNLKKKANKLAEEKRIKETEQKRAEARLSEEKRTKARLSEEKRTKARLSEEKRIQRQKDREASHKKTSDSTDESAIWEKAGKYYADDIAAYTKAGVSAQEAVRWKKLGKFFISSVNRYLKINVSIDEAERWNDIGVTYAHKIQNYQKLNISIDEAENYKKVGVDNPESIDKYRKAEK